MVGTRRNAAAIKRIWLGIFHNPFFLSFSGEQQFSQKTKIRAKLNTVLPSQPRQNKCKLPYQGHKEKAAHL